MSASIVRGRYVITKALDRHSVEQIDDGAVLVVDDTIQAIGSYDDLKKQNPDAQVIGSGRQVLLPGFVNGHHHVGLTPVQLGSPDMPLELWFVTRMVCRAVDLYLDTLYSAFEMISSGVTTVQHIHGWIPGKIDKVTAGANEVIRAYDDIGMRVSYSFALRDQNRLVYMDDQEFVKLLPEDLQPPMQRHFARFGMDLDDFMAMFENLHEQHHNKDRVGIQLAPANLHWCSDKALERLSETSKKYDAPMHMHLVETAYQKEYAKRRGGGTALDYIDRFDMLGPRMTLGHGVWLNQKDIERVAETGTHICHNCSSNFRLRSGVGALNVWEKHGVNCAMGMDEAGINDDRDMLQEMRMVLNAHRTPGVSDDVPTTAQVLRMATEGGAKTTAFGTRIGTLEVGKAADMVLMDWEKIAYPYLDREIPVVDAVIQRAKTDGVDMVMCAGDVIYIENEFMKVSRRAALSKLHDDLTRALTDEEVERRGLSKKLLPHVMKFYENYVDATDHVPFYKPSSSV
jgi:cytosine/adenosine deaminase-related metal-dependent hydrolase